MIPKQLQKPWLGAIAWLTMVYLTYVMLDGLRGQAGPTSWWLVALSVVQGILVVAITYSIATSDKALPQAPPLAQVPPPRRPFLYRAYLVVHLDLRVSPPVALFVHTYSYSAKDLTLTGAHEARADLYMVEADTFQEALDEMERIQPLYFPWVTPLLTRNR